MTFRYTYQKAIGKTPSSTAEAKSAALGALAIAGLGTGLVYGSLALGSVAARTAGVRLGISYWRSPYATILAQQGRSAAWRNTGSSLLFAGKAYRYAGYYQFVSDPFATLRYLREGEYEKAMIQYFGPIGSVFVYNKYQESRKSSTKGAKIKQTRISKKPSKPSKVPKKQKMRLWRMGLRWCRQHGRYDRCSLRARR